MVGAQRRLAVNQCEGERDQRLRGPEETRKQGWGVSRHLWSQVVESDETNRDGRGDRQVALPPGQSRAAPRKAGPGIGVWMEGRERGALRILSPTSQIAAAGAVNGRNERMAGGKLQNWRSLRLRRPARRESSVGGRGRSLERKLSWE